MEDVRVVLRNDYKYFLSIAPISFKFIRERYTPYTQCSGVIIGDIDISQVNTIELYYQGKLLHLGMADSISKIHKNGKYIINFLSRGFTMLLGQNEPKPGIINDISLGSLISMNTHIPNVSWEATPANVNYIYVKEKSTIWDAICAYAYKAYGNYPYISGNNSVMASIPKNSTVFNYNNYKIITVGENVSSSGILSKVHMSDIEGNYSYTKDNDDAKKYNIVRNKYYPFDRQWLSSPTDGLLTRLKYSNRAINSAFIKYEGHYFENLMDKAKFTLEGNVFFNNEYISKVEFYGNKYGVFTQLTVYRDSYS